MYVPSKKPVHLVKNFFDVPAKKRRDVLLASEKIDGQYAFLRRGVGYSRTGKPYTSLLPLARLAESVAPSSVVIIEFCVDDAEGNRLPVNEISGFFRRDEECPQAYGIVHDIIPVHHFDGGCCPYVYAIRETAVQQFVGDVDSPWFRYNPVTEVAGDEESVMAYASQFIDAGLEGAVFKDPAGTWQAGKKDARQMKIKGEVSYDLEVTGVEEGKGKYKGTLGKLVCRWTDGRVVKVSGMRDDQRDEWWTYPGSIIGCIVKVDGMCLTPDGMIREPRFKEVRCDKETADV